METKFKAHGPCPKEKANVLSKLLFIWLVKLYRHNLRSKLTVSELTEILDEDTSSVLRNKLAKNWNLQKIKSEEKKTTPSLLVAIIQTFIGAYMGFGCLIFLMVVILKSFLPIILSKLLKTFSTPTDDQLSQLYTYGSLLVVISTAISFLNHHSMYGLNLIGMRIRIGVSSLIYAKVLKLHVTSISKTGQGIILNFLSNDVSRFELVTQYLHYLWIAPVQLVIVTYIMWQYIGITAVITTCSMVLITLPLQVFVTSFSSKIRLKVAERTDNRLSLLGEIFSGIKLIKMYVWETPFEKLVESSRNSEIEAIRSASYLRALILSSVVFVERFILFVAVVVYTILGGTISADILFIVAQLLNVLQLTVSLLCPLGLSIGAESLVSVRRIQEFLLMDEKEPEMLKATESFKQLNIEEIEEGRKSSSIRNSNSNSIRVISNGINKDIVLENASSLWQNTQVLTKFNLTIPQGSLCAFVGPAGSGKSCLLQILLGELPLDKSLPKNKSDHPSIVLPKKRAFCSQEPWIFSSSLKNNILFGKTFDRELYGRVVSLCALKEDFKQLPEGDETRVEENGIALSGGQRSRVNLARALYEQADVYLLDDPLSSLDSKIGKHIFERCIKTYLEGKTRILVTHQHQFLKKVDWVVLLNEGNVIAQGTYTDLIKNSAEFSKQLQQGQGAFEDIPNQERRLSLFYQMESPGKDVVSQDQTENMVGMGSLFALKQYLFSGGGCCTISSLVVIFVIGQLFCSGTDFWVSYWTEYTERRNNVRGMLLYYWETKDYIYVYAFLILMVILSTLIRSFLFYWFATKASRKLHSKMLQGVLRTPIMFFQLNSIGRISNRFSKDIGYVDESLPKVLCEAFQVMLQILGIFILIAITNVYMILVLIILGGLVWILRKTYLATIKTLKHIEGACKSPIFTHVNSTISGITTIRAFGAENVLTKEFDRHQDTHTSSIFLLFSCMASFGLWLDLLCIVFLSCIVFSFIYLFGSGSGVSSSIIGLAISQALTLMGLLQFGVRRSAEVVAGLTSVERVLQYTQLEKEGDHDPKLSGASNGLSEGPLEENWSPKGQIMVKNMSLCYNVNHGFVLKDFNLDINAGEKIGIVGRTGAGKSSFVSSLFRLSPIEGTILFDGVDTKTIDLKNHRKNISILPQEPVLFSGTIRFNLDPFGLYPDDELWGSLREVGLVSVNEGNGMDVSKTRNNNTIDQLSKNFEIKSLDYEIQSSGKNISVGQKQLLCLARSILSKNKILILDEATANIDHSTDDLIQRTIQTKFKDCTVLVVAHRLNTVIDSDRILVLEEGRVVEFDCPHKLLSKDNGYFRRMVKETGASMEEHLKRRAFGSYNRKR